MIEIETDIEGSDPRIGPEIGIGKEEDIHMTEKFVEGTHVH